MLDLRRLQSIRLSARPLGHRIVANALLLPNYRLGREVKIELEGLARLPDEPVVFAMNHTDRYNYWPFQYRLYRTLNRFTATWVKPKMYKNRLVGAFLEATNNIPVVSRGYLITADFVATMGRRPTGEEYDVLRALVDARRRGDDDIDEVTARARTLVPAEVFERPRSLPGRAFDPAREDYAGAIGALYSDMMARVLELHEEAFSRHRVDLLVFPEGTRSIRLSRGRPGAAQIALYFKKPIVPVGCNGCDRIYPGNSPVARGGRVVYRIGEPITWAELRPFHPDEPFTPFSAAAEVRHTERFTALTELVMDRINGLLDPRHQYGDDRESTGVSGSARFL